EHVDVQQRVGAQAVRAVDGHAGRLAGRVETGDDVRVVRQDLGLDVRGDAAHAVVGRGEHRDGLRVRLHAQVGAGELRDVRELLVDVRRLQVGEVQQDVVLVGTAAAALAD